MDTENVPPNGRGKRSKRESKRKREAKGTDGKDAPPPREKKSLASTGASAIPASELAMSMPILLADPREIDVVHPRPRQMNYIFSKRSEATGVTRDFVEIVDKYVCSSISVGDAQGCGRHCALSSLVADANFGT
jgi:COMPASS component BRE2